MSVSAQQLQVLTTMVERRFYPRNVPHAAIFIALDEGKEGLLINLSENGLLVSTPAELSCNFVARISISLNGLSKPIQVTVRGVWASEARKLVGIQLLDLSEHDREQIRKWGTQESTQSMQPETNHPLVVAAPSTTSHGSPHATPLFTEQTPFRRPPGSAPAAVTRIVRTRSASFAGIAMWSLLIATVSLAVAFFLRNGALGNPFARSTENRYESSAAALSAQDLQGSIQNPDTSNRRAESQAASPAPSVGAAKSERALSATPALQDSAKTGDTSPDEGSRGSADGAAQNQPDGSWLNSTSPSKPTLETDPTPGTSRLIAENRADARNDQSLTGKIPEVADDAPKMSRTAANLSDPSDATPEALPAVPDPPTAKEPIRNPMRANDVAAGTSTTPISGAIVPSTQSAPPRKPATAVIQMDAPGRQVLEIHFPRGYQASFFDLPGERVLESPSVTMRIQRSIHTPTTHAAWSFNRSKKVIVGELISRVDPQAEQIQISPGDSVLVKVTVAKDGRIESIRSIHGSANLALAVVKAVHEWRYQPTLVDNQPVETQCYVVVQFHAPARRTARQ